LEINKIYVKVDKQDYSGLYWLTELKGHNYLSVSYAGLKKVSKQIESVNMLKVDQIAKTMLSELIENLD